MLDQIKQSTRQACGRFWSTLKNRREQVNGSNLNVFYYIFKYDCVLCLVVDRSMSPFSLFFPESVMTNLLCC